MEMEAAVPARLPAEFCAQLVEQFELIGWDRLEAVSPSLRDLDLVSQYEPPLLPFFSFSFPSPFFPFLYHPPSTCHRDRKGRRHTVHVSLPSDFPQSAPTCRCDLPAAPEPIAWDPFRSTLHDILRQFERNFDLYQEFWDAMDDLDTHCLVLEPENPTRSATLRRLSLGTSAFSFSGTRTSGRALKWTLRQSRLPFVDCFF